MIENSPLKPNCWSNLDCHILPALVVGDPTTWGTLPPLTGHKLSSYCVHSNLPIKARGGVERWLDPWVFQLTGMKLRVHICANIFTSFVLGKIETCLFGVRSRPMDLWKAELSLYNMIFRAFTKLALRKSYASSKFLPQIANSPWLIFLLHNHQPRWQQLLYEANTCPTVSTSGSK